MLDTAPGSQAEPNPTPASNSKEKRGQGGKRTGADHLSPGLTRIREAARRDKKIRFSALLHHVTEDLLTASYRKLNPKAAPGVDDLTWKQYGEGLEERIRVLHQNVHGGRYRSKPTKRAYIPKENGEQRPLGIAALEDKIVQQAAVWVLEPIYEEQFQGFSYGFRPGRHPHKALDALYMAIKTRRVNWILDADIRKFFDSVSHEWIMRFLKHRIADQRILRLVAKWLRAGVSEDGKWSKTTVGTPQGAVISPLLANIYLHYVMDLWVKQWRERKIKGDLIIVRYADDVVIGFQNEPEARAFRVAWGERLKAFGLEPNEEKTRLIEFGRYAVERRAARGMKKPETFDFLGFTHICGQSRSTGRFMLRRQTSAKRLRRKLKEIRRTLLWHRHKSIPEQGRWLRQVLQGYFQYHAIPGNDRALQAMRFDAAHAWMRALRRRSQRGRKLNWEFMRKLIEKWFPTTDTLHPYPDERFAVPA